MNLNVRGEPTWWPSGPRRRRASWPRTGARASRRRGRGAAAGSGSRRCRRRPARVSKEHITGLAGGGASTRAGSALRTAISGQMRSARGMPFLGATSSPPPGSARVNVAGRGAGLAGARKHCDKGAAHKSTTTARTTEPMLSELSDPAQAPVARSASGLQQIPGTVTNEVCGARLSAGSGERRRAFPGSHDGAARRHGAAGLPVQPEARDADVAAVAGRAPGVAGAGGHVPAGVGALRADAGGRRGVDS